MDPMNPIDPSLAAASDIPEIRRVRHPLQVRRLAVLAVDDIAPHLRRLTLAGDSLADLHSDGFDDHVKLLLPPPGLAALPEAPRTGPDGRPDWGDSPRPIARDYTPRCVDRDARTLQIEFHLHGQGPAARWASGVRPGDTVHIGGPRGSMVVPTDLRWQWLVGDESALPAMARRLEELPADVDVTVVVETETLDEALPPLALAGPRRLVRVARPAAGDAEALAAPLVEAVRALPTPRGRGHAFAAAESRTAQAVREVLVGHHGLARGQVRASAYWRRGESGHHENLEG